MKDKIVLQDRTKRKINKYQNNSIENVILKDHNYYGNNEYKSNIEVKNYIIDFKRPKLYTYYAHFKYHYLKGENIYFKNTKNLDGITLYTDYLRLNNISFLDFYWDPKEDKVSNIKEINIITFDNKIKIELNNEELEDIEIEVNKDIINIDIEYINSRKIYEIDNNGNLKETLMYHTITENDLNNGILDLTKFKELSPITLEKIKIDTLYLNKDDIPEIQNINLYDDVYIKNIKIIDNNEMKLNPNTIIPFNDNLDCCGKNIISDNKKILIYVDDNNILKVFNKDEILSNNNLLSDIIFSEEEDDIVIIYKYKTLGKYKVIIEDKEYKIDKLFTLFIKENILKYQFKEEMINSLDNYDWVTLIDKNIYIEKFINMYNDYIVFKTNLNKLHKLGFSYKYFMYLHQKGLDKVLLEMCENFKHIEYSKNEINDLNELGKKYIKKLK